MGLKHDNALHRLRQSVADVKLAAQLLTNDQEKNSYTVISSYELQEMVNHRIRILVSTYIDECTR